MKTKSVTKGIFSIFSANMINKGIALIVNILIVRVLSQSDYGVFSSVNNTYNIFVLMNGLGTISGVLLHGSEKRDIEEKYAYYKQALMTAFWFNLIVTIGMLGYGMLQFSSIAEGNIYICKLAFLPMLDYLMQFFQTLMRCDKDNERYSLLLSVNSISYSVCVLLGAALCGLNGAIAGRYCSVVLSLLLGAYYSKDKLRPIIKSYSLKKKQKIAFIKYSMGIGASAAVSTAYYLIDVFLVEFLLKDSIVLAQYKVATIVPDNLIVIPTSIIVAVLPLFAENNDNKEWLKHNFIKTLSINLVINLTIVISLIILAPWLIVMLWGEAYMESVAAFRILCCSYFFIGTFKTLSTNFLSITRRVKETLLISIISLVCNVIFDVIFILQFGMIGAAFATLMVSFIASIVSLWHVKKVIYN